jgi:hypothetical protein
LPAPFTVLRLPLKNPAPQELRGLGFIKGEFIRRLKIDTIPEFFNYAENQKLPMNDSIGVGKV